MHAPERISFKFVHVWWWWPGPYQKKLGLTVFRTQIWSKSERNTFKSLKIVVKK